MKYLTLDIAKHAWWILIGILLPIVSFFLAILVNVYGTKYTPVMAICLSSGLGTMGVFIYEFLRKVASPHFKWLEIPFRDDEVGTSIHRWANVFFTMVVFTLVTTVTPPLQFFCWILTYFAYLRLLYISVSGYQSEYNKAVQKVENLVVKMGYSSSVRSELGRRSLQNLEIGQFILKIWSNAPKAGQSRYFRDYFVLFRKHSDSTLMVVMADKMTGYRYGEIVSISNAVNNTYVLPLEGSPSKLGFRLLVKVAEETAKK